MADQRERRLARAASQGDPAAQAQLLSQRVRLGRLEPARLALAAYLGESAAQLAVVGQRELYEDRALRQLDRHLQAAGHEASVRMALAAAECVTGLQLSQESTVEGALSGIRAWTVCPCWEHASEALLLAQDVPVPLDGGPRQPAEWAIGILAKCLRAAGERQGVEAAKHTLGVVRCAATEVARLKDLSFWEGLLWVREVAAEALVPWLLRE